MKKIIIISVAIAMSFYVNAGDCTSSCCLKSLSKCSDVKKVTTQELVGASKIKESKKIISQSHGIAANEESCSCCSGSTSLSQEIDCGQQESQMLTDSDLGRDSGDKEDSIQSSGRFPMDLDYLLAARKVAQSEKGIGVDIKKKIIDKVHENDRVHNVIAPELKSSKLCNPVKRIANQKNKPVNNNKGTKEIIQQAYGTVVDEKGFVCSTGGCCGGGASLSQEVGYTKQELEMFADANLGLGCGNPVNLGYIKEGFVVLDLGSGAGLDCFLASCRVGDSGKVIGVDMTKKMIDKARENARKYDITNVEFRQGDIESLPVESNSIDIVMSNCVINLAPNKEKVFQEAHRVLKAGGSMVVSDVVLLEQLTKEQKSDPKLLCACVGGAALKQDYLAMLERVGFEVTIIDEDKDINKKWFGSDELPISSLKFIAYKK